MDIDNKTLIATRTHRLEWILKEHYHAQGHGLVQLISSCDKRLPHDMVDKLRLVALIKHKMSHEKNFHIEDINSFVCVCNECERGLQPRSTRMIWRFAFFLIFGVTAGAMWFYFANWQYLASRF